jgi:hypothetical protein
MKIFDDRERNSKWRHSLTSLALVWNHAKLYHARESARKALRMAAERRNVAPPQRNLCGGTFVNKGERN